MTPVRLRLLLAMLPALLAALSACAPARNLQPVLTTEVDPSGKALNQASSFTPDVPRILCSVRVAGLPAGSTLEAQWQYRNLNLWEPVASEPFSVGASSYIVYSLNAPAPGWRSGDYRVRLLLDRREAASQEFSIRAAGGQPPVINSFAASPHSVEAGQPFTLSWNVTGATRVVIEPDIGSVGAGGNRQVIPAADTTLTLTALNGSGSASASTSVIVVPRPAGRADLAVLDLFRESVLVYYTVQNQGTAASQPCNSQLYVGPTLLGTDYVAPLEPGQRRTEFFGQFSWSYASDTTATVCIDTDARNAETNEDNNCLTRQLTGTRIR
jgi:hypothetical protein